MDIFTYEETVEKVAEALYNSALDRSGNPHADRWNRANKYHRDNYSAYARAAIKTYHLSVVGIPSPDPDDSLVRIAGRAHMAEDELAAIRVYAEENAGEVLDPDTSVFTAVQSMLHNVRAWEPVAKQYGDERDAAREELRALHEKHEALVWKRANEELDGDLYDRLMAFAKKLKSETRTGQEQGTPNEIARDDGYSYGRVDAGEELEALLTPRPSTWSVELERLKVELEKADQALADVSRAYGEAQRELKRRHRGRGQAAMNVLGIVRSDLHSAMLNTETDPYWDDSKLDAFFTWLVDVLSAEKVQARVEADNGVRHELADVEKEFGVEG